MSQAGDSIGLKIKFSNALIRLALDGMIHEQVQSLNNSALSNLSIVENFSSKIRSSRAVK